MNRISFIFTLLLMCLAPLQAQDLTNIGQQKPIRFSGSTELRGIFYNASGIANRRAPFIWLLSGNPTLSVYGWDIPFSFILSRDDRSFRQPFNQFGMSPTYKWLTLHGGYRNLSFSPYTLGGHTMLGGGVEANPGKWRLGFMYGRLNRATVIDTSRMALAPFSFSRKGWAAKVGYGTERAFFELSMLRAKDNPNSKPDNAHMLPQEYQSLPAANTVIGYAARIMFWKKIIFETDGAASIYTYDIHSPLDISSSVNTEWRKWMKMFDVNGTSEWAKAFNASIGYRERNYGIKITYRRVDPGFMSMGAYYIANDLENWTISPNFIFFNNKLRFNGSLGIQRDNLRDQKQASNRRVIGSAILGADISERLGVDVNFSNFSNSMQPKALVFADSLKIVQNTTTLNIMPRYTIIGEQTSQMIFLMANLNQMRDFGGYYSAEASNRDISTYQFSLNYNINFPKRNLSLFSSISYVNMSSASIKSSYNGISLGGNYGLMKNRLQTGANLSLMQNKIKTGTSIIINGSLNAVYELSSKHNLRALLFFTNNRTNTHSTGGYPNFRETRAEMAYQFRW